MLTGKKAVIFDMDGSLVDSMWIWPEVDRIFMKKYELTPPDSFHRDIEGMSYTETARYFVDTFRMSRTVEQVMQEWRDMTIRLYSERVYPKAGAVRFLDAMKQKGIALGIATRPGDLRRILIRSAHPAKYQPGSLRRTST